MKKRVLLLTAVMVVAVLLSGCALTDLFKGGDTYKVSVEIDPKGAAEVKGLAKKYPANTIGNFTLVLADGYDFPEWDGSEGYYVPTPGTILLAEDEEDEKIELEYHFSVVDKEVKMKATFAKLEDE